MFCGECGTKIEEEAIFCQNCGAKTKALPEEETSIPSEKIELNKVFYSEDWRRKKVFTVSSLPYFDVMIDEKFLYIIELPQYSGGTTGLILGLLLLNIIGAVIGQSIGSSSDTKKRKWYRLAWVDLNHNLTSHDYRHAIFLQIPLENLKDNIIINKDKFTLTYNNEEVTLKKGQKEFGRFNEYVKKYVL